MPSNVESGLIGQRKAEQYLRKKNYVILESNYRLRTGEIDLIASDGAYIVFIEVKYRKNTMYGLPREAVTLSKQKKIKRTALHYIALHNLSDNDFRFDVVELLETETGLIINHIENAF